jgi:ASC-1-like (ASCH) protein
MKDWEDIMKERLTARKAELPESDWNDFLSRKAAHELAGKRRRRILFTSISIPAAAAVLLLLFIMPFSADVNDVRMAQVKQPQQERVAADSMNITSVDTIVPVDTVAPVVPVVPEVKKPVVRSKAPYKSSVAQVQPSEPEPVPVQENVQGLMDERLIAQNKPAAAESDDMMLSEVAITGVVARVQMINDTAMFNSAAYKLPEGSSVEDLIRKLPGVKISEDGTITVNGKVVQQIKVNDKVFWTDDKTIALNQLTADMIEKVKAYDKASDMNRQTGIDDGMEATVLDIDLAKVKSYDSKRNLSRNTGIDDGMEVFVTDLWTSMIVVNGQITSVDHSRLTGHRIGKKIRKRDVALLLGIPAGKIKSMDLYDSPQGRRIWGEKGAHGVISVVTR